MGVRNTVLVAICCGVAAVFATPDSSQTYSRFTSSKTEDASKHLSNAHAQNSIKQKLQYPSNTDLQSGMRHRLEATGNHQSGAASVIAWAYERYGRGLVVSTSFGEEAAAVLHMATRVTPNMTVLWIDNSAVSPSTRAHATALTNRLGLNLKVVRPALSRARLEQKFGPPIMAASKRLYKMIETIEPMMRGLADAGATAVVAGYRGHPEQPVLKKQHGVVKVCPLLGWSKEELLQYSQTHDLPLHPLMQPRHSLMHVLDNRSLPPTASRGSARKRVSLPSTPRSPVVTASSSISGLGAASTVSDSQGDHETWDQIQALVHWLSQMILQA